MPTREPRERIGDADAGGHTTAGPVRADNEDCFLVDAALGLYAVADGMGGHLAGEVASHLAVTSLAAAVHASQAPAFDWPLGRDADAVPAVNHLRHAVLRANATVLSTSEADASLAGMGTTLTAVMITPGTAAIASVGDSRAYRVRAGTVEQLTRDDSWLVSVLGAAEARHAASRAHPMRHVLTRVIGARDLAVPTVLTVVIEPGDVFVLTTDGLHNVVDDQTIAALASSGPADVGARALVELAVARRTSDNATAVVVRPGSA